MVQSGQFVTASDLVAQDARIAAMRVRDFHGAGSWPAVNRSVFAAAMGNAELARAAFVLAT
jgi:hypothetical protein